MDSANEIPAFETWDGDIAFGYTIDSYARVHDHNPQPFYSDLRLYNIYAWPAADPFFVPMEPMPKP